VTGVAAGGAVTLGRMGEWNIDTLRVGNFRAFESFTIDFAPELTVLVGPTAPARPRSSTWSRFCWAR
jgi:hypothetical protein